MERVQEQGLPEKLLKFKEPSRRKESESEDADNRHDGADGGSEHKDIDMDSLRKLMHSYSQPHLLSSSSSTSEVDQREER